MGNPITRGNSGQDLEKHRNQRRETVRAALLVSEYTLNSNVLCRSHAEKVSECAGMSGSLRRGSKHSRNAARID